MYISSTTAAAARRRAGLGKLSGLFATPLWIILIRLMNAVQPVADTRHIRVRRTVSRGFAANTTAAF